MIPSPSTVYGLPRPADVADRSGREVLQAIIDGRLPQAPISETMSFWIVEVGEGFAAFEGEPAKRLLNPMGTVHGGWALTLLDSAGGSAGLTLLPAGVGYTTVETKGNLCRPITADVGRVRAEGRVVSSGKQIITAEVKVASREGKVLAHGLTTLLVLGGR